jgi:hypothetical protein
MMTLPTDRGTVVLTNEDEDRQSVLICARFADGEPVDVFAMHRAVRAVEVHAEVKLIPVGAGRYSAYSDGMATVFRDSSGTVHILAPARGKGLLDEAPRRRSQGEQ